QINSVVQGVGDERAGCLLSDYRLVGLILGQDNAGELEVVKGLLVGHVGALRPGAGWLGGNVSCELALCVESGAASGSGDALDAACVGQFLPIRCEPSFAVRRCVNTRC